MHCWRGVLVHSIFITFQPLYLAARYFLDPSYFGRLSTSWLAITATSWIYIVTRISLPFFRSPLRHLPSPPNERFPIGHFKPAGGKLPIEALGKLFATPNDGLLVVWGIFYLYCEVVPTRPDLCMDILNTHSYDWEKPAAARRLLSRVLGNGLINVEGNEHKAMRKVVAPAFSGRHVRDLVPLFYGKGLAFANSMAREVANTTDGVLEMMAQMSRVTLDIVGAAGVGKDFNTIETDDDPLAKLYATITDTNRGSIFVFFMVTAFGPPWLVRRLGNTSFARVARATTQLRKDVHVLMQEKKQLMLEKPEWERQKDIIATIMASGDFSDDYLTNQLLTFLAAGHDTTASALTWTTWLLSLNPEIQDRLRAECASHLAHKTELEVDASIFDADTMPYLTAVCNETLRLYPTVPATARHAAVPTTIGKMHVPKGTPCLILPWTMQRSTEFWGADAEDFNPDRWLNGPNAANGGATTPYAFLTFLHGPRSCIGQTFARVEMKCLLAALIMRFKFELADPDEEVEVGGFITIKPHNGLRLRLHEIDVRL